MGGCLSLVMGQSPRFAARHLRTLSKRASTHSAVCFWLYHMELAFRLQRAVPFKGQ